MNCLNHPDRPRVAFCQNCGKPLCAECMRVVGSAVFCEPCLEARLAAANGPSTGAPGAGTFGTGPAAASAHYETTPDGRTAYPVAEGVPYPGRGTAPAGSAHNPGLALLLGFIPGVGAMYNGQYAKGVVHLVVFAVLVSLADQHGIFGMFVAGWIAYQAFEAYHTAKARRDGTPLPNPFGLNDLGERLGFGRAWGAPFTTGSPTESQATTTPGTPYSNPYQGVGPEPVGDAAAAQATYSAGYAPPSGIPYANTAQGPNAGPAASAGWGAPVDSYGYPYSASSEVNNPMAFSRRSSRFPVGAIVLIGLGVLFLIGNAGWMEGFPIHRLLPFLLIGLGVWIFIRRMLDTGPGLADDGTPGYRVRVYRALRGSIWVVLVGVLFLLDSFRILSWGHSWPLFIIVGGVVAILERGAYRPVNRFAYATQPSAPVPPPSSSVVPPSPQSTAIVAAEPSSRDTGEAS